jgi:hypothetical protein
MKRQQEIDAGLRARAQLVIGDECDGLMAGLVPCPEARPGGEQNGDSAGTNYSRGEKRVTA